MEKSSKEDQNLRGMDDIVKISLKRLLDLFGGSFPPNRPWVLFGGKFRRIVCRVQIHGNFKDNVECYLVEVFRRIGHEYYLVENFRRIVCQVKIHGNFKGNVE